uniref:Uncharacterized protein n=1 Tax=Chenopodium quinoa TaxID=63459 RepID=A0A803KTK1_CHEQI
MAASANPSGNQHHQEQSSFNGGGPAASTSNEAVNPLYASVSSIIRYAKVAMDLPNKTVRDVALRARWMNEKVTESSSKSSQLHASRPGGHTYPVPAVPLDDEDGISYKAIGGHVGELLEQNKQFFQQISANFSSYQIQENISLFRQAYDNIKKLLNNNGNVDDTPEIMRQMPQLPVKLNEELTMAIIPASNHSKH